MIRLFILIEWSEKMIEEAYLLTEDKTDAALAADTTKVIVHYYRFDGNYDGWNIWSWPKEPIDGAGAAYYFTDEDAFGKIAEITIDGDITKMGLMIRKGDWEAKDIGIDRYVENITGTKEVWLLQGQIAIYDQEPPKTATMNAFADASNVLTVKLNVAISLSGINNEGFEVFKSGGGNTSIEIIDVINARSDDNSKIETDLVTITLKQDIMITDCYAICKEGYQNAAVKFRGILENCAYIYTGNDLGAVYDKTATAFRLWAPTATNITILLFEFSDTETCQRYAMHKSEKGTWTAKIVGDLDGKYYLYEISLLVDGVPTIYTVNDPYAYGSAANSSRTLIYSPAKVNSAIPKWHHDKFIKLKNNVDAVIYETHVRDLTIDKTSGVPDEYRGKYLGFIYEDARSPGGAKTGISHFSELGVTHIHIMPSYDYGVGDETEANNNYSWYNWGYDPVLYNNIEGSYATSPKGTTRQFEYKRMVQALHKKGLGVIADVVYNHTFQTGDAPFSIFDKIVPGYFYRIDDDGNYIAGSGCGNDVATERPMVRKFIVDSVKYIMKEYHIDGFRFDLLGLIDIETMLQVYKEAKQINPNAIIYGEAWNIATGLDPNLRMIQANIQNTGIGAFNDGIRDNLKGDVFKAESKGFIQGSMPMTGIGRLQLQIKGQDTGREQYTIPVATPNETINYVSVHDNACLWDKLTSTNPEDSTADRIKKAKLANAIILTSQGVPFLLAGDDFGRSKNGNSNSYNNNDPNVNPIHWSLKATNKDMFNYHKGLIALRKAHPAFRMTNVDMVNKSIEFANSPDSVIEYVIKDHANGDAWKHILVIFNSNNNDLLLKVKGKWTIVVDGENAGVIPLAIVKDEIAVSAHGTIIAYTNGNFELG